MLHCLGVNSSKLVCIQTDFQISIRNICNDIYVLPYRPVAVIIFWEYHNHGLRATICGKNDAWHYARNLKTRQEVGCLKFWMDWWVYMHIPNEDGGNWITTTVCGKRQFRNGILDIFQRKEAYTHWDPVTHERCFWCFQQSCILHRRHLFGYIIFFCFPKLSPGSCF